MSHGTRAEQNRHYLFDLFPLIKTSFALTIWYFWIYFCFITVQLQNRLMYSLNVEASLCYLIVFLTYDEVLGPQKEIYIFLNNENKVIML